MIYLVQPFFGGPHPFKVGYAANPQRRLAELQIGSPLWLSLVSTIDGDVSLEQRIHSSLRVFRLHGEWFTPAFEARKVLSGYGFDTRSLAIIWSISREESGPNGDPRDIATAAMHAVEPPKRPDFRKGWHRCERCGEHYAPGTYARHAKSHRVGGLSAA